MLLRSVVVSCSLWLCLSGSLLAQQKVEPAPAGSAVRVHVIGASVSGGFRDGPMTGATETGETVTM